jgi:undecaprenyl diphosphate synthase
MDTMSDHTSASDITEAAPQLHHIIVVGGTLTQWSAMTEQQWSLRMAELGKVADHCGARWLSLRPFSGDASSGAVPARSVVVGNCRVDVSPEPDGRVRVSDAIVAMQAQGIEVDEANLGTQLNLPADCDPDLVVVLGAPDHLPTSLVWELAYSELVFTPIAWDHLGANHLDDAIGSYAHRHRRFGGVD